VFLLKTVTFIVGLKNKEATARTDVRPSVVSYNNCNGRSLVFLTSWYNAWAQMAGNMFIWHPGFMLHYASMFVMVKLFDVVCLQKGFYYFFWHL
jgi:hypothetical protein